METFFRLTRMSSDTDFEINKNKSDWFWMNFNRKYANDFQSPILIVKQVRIVAFFPAIIC